jgi:sialate O-acetylesterase
LNSSIKSFACLIAVSVLGPSIALGNVRLPALVGDNMVLQRDAPIAIWGWADSRETVHIRFHGQTLNTAADSAGRWKVSVGPFGAGGPYEMTIRAGNTLVIRNILIGDVWLASGQSNMEFPLAPDGVFSGVADADLEVARADFRDIRLFKLQRKFAAQPLDNAQAEWLPVTPSSVRDFSAVAYLFGRELQQRYQVPIGLIQSTWSGTAAAPWISKESLKQFPEFQATLDSLHDGQGMEAGTATVLFNGMISPLTPYRLKGVIWYQGESDAMDHPPERYRALFPALIQDWRRQWGYDLPFLFVQLAGFGPNRSEPSEYPWASFREAQREALLLPHTGMATAVDVGEETNIHPRDKQDVAHRLALTAAKIVYGQRLVSSGPDFRSMRIERGRIRILFKDVGSGLLVKDEHGHIRGFEIAGADAKFVWAAAKLDGRDVLVSSETVPHPVAVRYDWRNTPDGNLYNKDGLPALPFRTDARR